MRKTKLTKKTQVPNEGKSLKSIHEELYKDGKSVDEIIEKYPQLKVPLEQARSGIEEQRKAMEQMYTSGVLQETQHYLKELRKIADRLQPALKILKTVGHSPSSKHVQEIGPLKFSIEVTPTVKSIAVSLQGVQSGLKTIKNFRKKDVLFPSLITPESQLALDMIETKELTKEILAGQNTKKILTKHPIGELNSNISFIYDGMNGHLHIPPHTSKKFSGKVAQLVNFFYNAHDRKEWTSYQDIIQRLPEMSRAQIKDDIRDINKRMFQHTKNKIKQVIDSRKTGETTTSAKEYRWAL